MNPKDVKTTGCCENIADFRPEAEKTLKPTAGTQPPAEVCCGSPPGPESHRFERPGYALHDFVEAFVETPVGPIPRVKTFLKRADYAGKLRVRLGINRDQYKIAPGLYCVGTPDANAPVLVTANYKLTFDILRKELASIAAWILVLDTRGINVWCAAGKNLFSTEELVRRIKLTEIKKVVSHNQLILPQLAATGVAGQRVKKQSGFNVIWGPLRAQDIKKFLADGLKADKRMRRVTFTTTERMILIPVELSHLPRPSLWILLAAFAISGLGTDIFSFSAAWPRGLRLAVAYGGGIFSGAVAVPALLPWIPGRSFALKGAIVGTLTASGIAVMFGGHLPMVETVALMLCTTAVSSYLAMNFTGATPFTSPSGVEKEMRKALPMQAGALLLMVVAWVASAFAG